MLLAITTTHVPATDLGYLLAKNPARPQQFALGFGRAHVFYPEVGEARCTAALLLEVDPIGLSRARRRGGGEGAPLAPYVNDRPYVASSFMSVAIAQVFGSAMKGRSRERQELAELPIPLTASLEVVRCRGGEKFLRALFEPLGYSVEAEHHALDETFPSWGDSPYFSVRISARVRLSELLSHLYVLIPVLDDDKHYWVGEDELEKLLRAGEGWLDRHPEREQIALRYLKRQRHLASDALVRLMSSDQSELEKTEDEHARGEDAIEAKLSLNELRLDAVIRTLETEGAARVIDLGCGPGKLLQLLLERRAFTKIAGADVSVRALEIAKSRLRLDDLPRLQRQRIELFQASVTYRDQRFSGYDAACAIEVIEHLDPSRLKSFERVVFELAGPPLVVLTTPNREYNACFSSLGSGQLRHRDHRFEWTRAELEAWARSVAARQGYQVRFEPIGPVDAERGAPTQMAVFRREGSAP